MGTLVIWTFFFIISQINNTSSAFFKYLIKTLQNCKNQTSRRIEPVFKIVDLLGKTGLGKVIYKLFRMSPQRWLLVQDRRLNPRKVVADQLIIDAFCDTAKLAILLLRFVQDVDAPWLLCGIIRIRTSLVYCSSINTERFKKCPRKCSVCSYEECAHSKNQ